MIRINIKPLSINKCKSCEAIIPLNKKYCNANCMTNHYRIGIVKTNCLVCFKIIQSPKSVAKKYCSQNCYHKIKLGKKRPFHSASMKGNTHLLGKKQSLIRRIKSRGENSVSWKGGITKIEHKIRRLPEYDLWKKNIHNRDRYTCVECKSKCKKLECHHVISFKSIIKNHNIKNVDEAINCSVLWDLSNGISLCKECHKKTKSYGKN